MSSTAELTGRLVADVASMVLGVAEAGGGAGVAGGGIVACGTGVGCLATPEALVAGGALIAQGTGTVIRAGEGAGTTLAAFSASFSSSKKGRQAQNRGWTNDLLDDLLKDPAQTASTVNRATGNSATVYYDADGNYVVVDDETGEIFHLSDRNDPDWFDPFGKQKKK